MAIEIKAPSFPESVADGTISKWHKQPGEAVKRDELLVDIETDKVVLEVLAEADGVLASIVKGEGDTVLSNELIATLDAGATASAAPAAAAAPAASTPAASAADDEDPIAAPAARQLAAENGINLASVKGTGKDGRITKEDLVAAIEAKKSAPAAAPAAKPVAAAAPVVATGDRTEKRVPMTRVRATVAKRLVEAQSNMAMLTTFNEVDMTEVMALRSKYKDLFEKKHGVRLGFMGFFAKAACMALKDLPSVNASIEGDEIVYHDYADISVAVSGPGGLVVPVIRDADQMSVAQIEKTIGDFGRRAKDGSLKMEEMKGGTFTISNGGVFGSLMSTPIINPPQSAVLGLHRIEDRAVVVNGQIVIRPMMYLALSYDHRLIDGREAVTFLVALKNAIEDPTRILIDL